MGFLRFCLFLRLSMAFVVNPSTSLRKYTESCLEASSTGDATLEGLRVAVVGAGPAGLLLSHGLLKAGASVQIFEKRPKIAQDSSSRAYALGVGIRGRTAIRGTDESVWQAIQQYGYSSERFVFHAGPLKLYLRDESSSTTEPSLLIYQTDLCQVMTQELEHLYGATGRLELNFGTEVTKLDLNKKRIETATKASSFDLVVGCDGVNSVVRQTFQNSFDAFESTTTPLPGVFKVAKCIMPESLDPSAVHLLLPKAGTTTAFVEPTTTEACLLLAGRNTTDPILSGTDTAEIASELEARFPQLSDYKRIASQLASKTTSQASSVTCNTYHYGDVGCLCGDAAHATGGVSGQGVNSALQDTVMYSNA